VAATASGRSRPRGCAARLGQLPKRNGQPPELAIARCADDALPLPFQSDGSESVHGQVIVSRRSSRRKVSRRPPLRLSRPSQPGGIVRSGCSEPTGVAEQNEQREEREERQNEKQRMRY